MWEHSISTLVSSSLEDRSTVSHTMTSLHEHPSQLSEAHDWMKTWTLCATGCVETQLFKKDEAKHKVRKQQGRQLLRDWIAVSDRIFLCSYSFIILILFFFLSFLFCKHQQVSSKDIGTDKSLL